MKSLNVDYCGDTPSGEFRLFRLPVKRPKYLLMSKNWVTRSQRQVYNNQSLHKKVLANKVAKLNITAIVQ